MTTPRKYNISIRTPIQQTWGMGKAETGLVAYQAYTTVRAFSNTINVGVSASIIAAVANKSICIHKMWLSADVNGLLTIQDTAANTFYLRLIANTPFLVDFHPYGWLLGVGKPLEIRNDGAANIVLSANVFYSQSKA